MADISEVKAAHKNIKLNKQIYLNNGAIKTKVCFYSGKDVTTTTQKILFIEKCLKSAFSKVSGIKYKGVLYPGFPSPLHKTQQIYIHITKKSTDRMSILRLSERGIPTKDKKYPILLYIHADMLTDPHATNILVHELYHILASEHEHQDKLNAIMAEEAYRNKKYFDEIYHEDTMELFNEFNILCNAEAHASTSESMSEINRLVQLVNFNELGFRKRVTVPYRIIADMGLNYIAIKFFDTDVMALHLNAGKKLDDAIFQYLKRMHAVLKDIKRREKNAGVKNALVSIMILLEWKSLVLNLPYHAIAYCQVKRPYADKQCNEAYLKYHILAKKLVKYYESELKLAEPPVHKFAKMCLNNLLLICKHQSKTLQELTDEQALREIHHEDTYPFVTKLQKTLINATYELEQDYKKKVALLHNYLLTIGK